MFGRILNVDYAALSPKVGIVTDQYKIEIKGQDEYNYIPRYNIYGARFSTDSYRNQKLESISFISENNFGKEIERNIEVSDDENEEKEIIWEVPDLDFLLENRDNYKVIEGLEKTNILTFEIVCKEIIFNIKGITQILKFQQLLDIPITINIKVF